MRFAIATIDRYLGIFEAFIRAGWTPVKLFTPPKTSDLDNQEAVIACAGQNQAGIQLSRITPRDLQQLRDEGCEALIVASHNWKIPDWHPYFKYAVNFHSSPLPDARGPYPVVRAILENKSHWAITCHQLTSEIDCGPILGTERFPLQSDECHESLDLKIQMAGKKLAHKIAGQFVTLWDHAVPQVEGSYWNRSTLPDRIINFHQPVGNVMRHIRAYGRTESLARIHDTWLIVKRAVGWVELHDHQPGSVVHVFNKSIVVATVDGYVGLLEIDLAPQPLAIKIEAELNAAT